MEELLAKFGWQKIAIVIVLLGVIVLGFSLYSLFSTNNSAKQTGSKGQESADNWTTSNGQKLKGKFSDNASDVYKTPYYELTYPDYYQVEELPKRDTLGITKFTDKASSANITVTVVDMAKKSVEDMESPYIFSGGFDPESYPLGKFVVDEYYKTDPNNGRLLEKVIFVKKDGKIIKSDFTYTSDNSNYQVERDFVRFVSSIK